MITGACLCGAVRYQADSLLPQLTHCHCSMCRKHHGAAFASFVEAPEKTFSWLAGEHLLKSYASSSARQRRFCEVCGSVAPTLLGQRFWLPAGNLLGDLAITNTLHCFVASRAPWHVIGNSLPAYDGPAPGWTTDVERPPPPAVADASHGSCLCGAVRFSVCGTPARWLMCHCSRCRRARSSAHGSNAFYPLTQFTWQSGQDLVKSYRLPEAARFAVTFCVRCGGGAPVEREGVPFVLVPAGLLDGDPGSRPQAHIHMASKSTWYPVHDELPQFQELPPA